MKQVPTATLDCPVLRSVAANRHDAVNSAYVACDAGTAARGVLLVLKKAIDDGPMVDADGLLTNRARFCRMSLSSSALPGQVSLKFRTQNSGVRSECRKSSMNVVASKESSRDESFTRTVALPLTRF